ncbi:MAG TPA: hypothetical protein VK067_02450 [Pseudogracilibacillus sp.]|nr:hypothetical protein [Pseudogracilibacillus sp.]
MKFFSRIFVLLSTMILLTACINIPIGDGNKLKINKKGVTITDDEGDEHKFEVSDDGVKMTDGKTGEEKFDLSEEGMTYKDEKGQEQKITLDEDGEQIVMEGFDEDGEEVGFKMGEDVELPKDLPKDIPLTKDVKVNMATNTNSEVVVGYNTNEPFDKVVALYDDFFEKGTFEGTPEVTEQSYEGVKSKGYQGIRSDGEMTVQVIEMQDEIEGIQVSIYFYKQEE